MSAGYKLPYNESWVYLLAEKLKQENYDAVVDNASVAGATTTEGLNALPRLLAKDKPNLLILALGSNDALRGTAVLRIKANLGSIISKAQDDNIKVLLVGFKIPPNYGLSYTKSFENLYYALSKQYDIPLVPFLLEGFADNLDYFQKDRLHPTAEAQELILNNVWHYLKPMLK